MLKKHYTVGAIPCGALAIVSRRRGHGLPWPIRICV